MKTLAVNYRPTMQRYMLKQRFVTGGNQLRGWLLFMLGDCECKGWVKSLLNTNKFVSVCLWVEWIFVKRKTDNIYLIRQGKLMDFSLTPCVFMVLSISAFRALTYWQLISELALARAAWSKWFTTCVTHPWPLRWSHKSSRCSQAKLHFEISVSPLQVK